MINKIFTNTSILMSAGYASLTLSGWVCDGAGHLPEKDNKDRYLIGKNSNAPKREKPVFHRR